eukprot:CAMPEP_0170191680 /NCGR_PEP_ID=MMETSP0040_2-20121228/52272_1 /TAXON_ID=641309 /ORGANISM="Lotharella oceanica, Strain CCMP622" /LENGTH=169 /DNA_ID=CAMNT_0010439825 /DNA_START=1036 /DNA_END=1546 /DNA_ORIENTATION=-
MAFHRVTRAITLVGYLSNTLPAGQSVSRPLWMDPRQIAQIHPHGTQYTSVPSPQPSSAFPSPLALQLTVTLALVTVLLSSRSLEILEFPRDEGHSDDEKGRCVTCREGGGETVGGEQGTGDFMGYLSRLLSCSRVSLGALMVSEKHQLRVQGMHIIDHHQRQDAIAGEI